MDDIDEALGARQLRNVRHPARKMTMSIKPTDYDLGFNDVYRAAIEETKMSETYLEELLDLMSEGVYNTRRDPAVVAEEISDVIAHLHRRIHRLEENQCNNSTRNGD